MMNSQLLRDRVTIGMENRDRILPLTELRFDDGFVTDDHDGYL